MSQEPIILSENESPAGLSHFSRLLFSVLRRIRRGSLTLELADGRRFVFAGEEPGPTATLVVHRQRFARRAILGGNIGFAEAYMDGDWGTPDLAALLELMCINDSVEDAHYPRRLALAAHRLWHWLRPNSRRGSKRNIAAHYDLGNEFYRRWLDPSMTYSSAVFPATAMGRAGDLTEAQYNKYRLICEKLALAPGQRLLEIGCGWGGFAAFVAREFGAKVTAITVSKEQLAFARARIQREGLADNVEARFIDYRDLSGTFDRIASIEMFEAVGENYWPAFFDKVRENLAPGGRAALQVITIADTWFERYRRGVDFIQRYIFPGGMLPSATALERET
ncbi:MAG: class I SAM-dependent methyltransferase, partial [Alphaproteobacteria bacterium]|nr:class I SAM-dependent methyltransferase [Alphaproteobacteria bacterium]